jgi:ELWxxDGT repeat protein
VNSRLYFSADDGNGTEGRELWKSDGLAAGTVLVADVAPGAPNSSPESLTEFGGELYFSADNGPDGRELWKSNGGAIGVGTVLVANLDPSPGADSFPTQMVGATDGNLYFAANNGTIGEELWKTNGATTVYVDDINAGAASSEPQGMVEMGSLLYFPAHTQTYGTELWDSIPMPEPSGPLGLVAGAASCLGCEETAPVVAFGLWSYPVCAIDRSSEIARCAANAQRSRLKRHFASHTGRAMVEQDWLSRSRKHFSVEGCGPIGQAARSFVRRGCATSSGRLA